MLPVAADALALPMSLQSAWQGMRIRFWMSQRAHLLSLTEFATVRPFCFEIEIVSEAMLFISACCALPFSEVGSLSRVAQLACVTSEAMLMIRVQGVLPKLLIEIRQAFPSAMLYTPADHGARNASDWPSMAKLVAGGRRVMVVSGADYGADAASVLFTRPDVCNWQVHWLPC